MKKSPFFEEKRDFFEENAQFQGLIRYYARKLSDPHAEGDLWGFLCIVKILTENKYPDKYYAVCLRNEYIRLSKVDNFSRGNIPFEDWEKWEEFDLDKKIDLADSVQCLSDAELSAIRLQYGFGYNTLECSARLGISRQAFTKNRKRAFEKMRERLTVQNFS
jgi:hypothetical protein